MKDSLRKARNRKNQRLFKQIVDGFSPGGFEGGDVYFKHFGLMDSTFVDTAYDEAYERSLAMGVPTEEQRLGELVKQGSWKQEYETEIADYEAELVSLKASAAKMALKRDIDANLAIQKEVGEKKKLRESVRDSLMGSTAEGFAEKRSEEVYIYLSSFRDSSLVTPICPPPEFEEWSDERLGSLIKSYNRVMEPVIAGVKGVALTPILQNMLGLGKKVSEFYGKPLVKLTSFQIELLSYALYYQHILSSGDSVPEKAREDPEELERWFNAAQAAKEALDKQKKERRGSGTDMTSIVGAKSEDLEYAGVNKGQTVNLAEMLKDGARMDDMVKQGIL